MRVIFYIIAIVAGLFFLGACNPNPQPGSESLLEQAESLMDTDPDSAMQLIDSLFYPEKSLDNERYMRFLVTQVQAKYKTYRPIHEDTLVFRARDYFSGRDKEPRMAALAWFYSGCVYRERKEYNEAMQQYSTAGDYAAKTGDKDLQGLVQYNTGDLFAEQGLYKEALEYYTEAVRFYRTQPDKQAQCFSAAGRMYTILQQPDSAFRYFYKGLEIAEAAGDTELQSLLAQNLSVAYTNTKQFDKAEIYLRQSYSLNTDSAKLPRYYLNFAELYAMGRPDSAVWYTEQLKRHINTAEDDYFKASAYSYLAGWEKAQANYDAAFAYQEARMKTLSRIMKERGNQSVYEVHLKYNYEQMQKQYYMDLSDRQRWIFALLVAVMGGGILSTWYWIRQRNKRAEAQRDIDTLQGMNRELESAIYQKRLDLRKNLLWRFNISREMLEINREINKPDRIKFDDSHWIGQFNKIVYGKRDIEEVWDALFETFNEVQPGLAEKIKEKYPDLTETEFRVCILVYAGFNISETALILHFSPNTIQARRSDVRRKMGLDIRGDIAAHIDQL
jgi:Bacterial regulatory proteins, luxR family.